MHAWVEYMGGRSSGSILVCGVRLSDWMRHLIFAQHTPKVLYRMHGVTTEEEEAYPGGDDYEYEGYEEGDYGYDYGYSAYDAGADTGQVQFYSTVDSDWSICRAHDDDSRCVRCFSLLRW